jgi:septin family protein
VILDYQDFSRLVQRFATVLPKILSSHHKTADLAPQISGLLQIAETPFTLAVVGQMRVGKSSLLNALVGADLAVVGVNETTATINWFKYGQGDKTQRFCVNWKDRPAEEFDLKEIHRWVGDSAEAAATNCLEFFTTAPYLRIANIVDTPGTRSAIQDHTHTINEFLASKLDGETRRLGGEADAILYVVPHVARESDETMLKDFESTTRLPGASPYNSLAAVHKWETLNVDDPHEEALRKAERIFKTMRGLVSVVAPVSAPLGKAAEQFEDRFWHGILNLALNTPAAVLDDMLLGELDFYDESPRCSIPSKDRRELQSQFPLPWPCLKLIIQTTRKKSPGTASDLRRHILDISGIDRLRQELQNRFFEKSKVIKTFSVLSKASDTTRTAEVRLRNYKSNVTRILENAVASQSVLVERINRGDSDLRPVQEYVQTSLQTMERDLENTGDTLRQLGEAVLEVEDAYQGMDADLKYLQLLQDNRASVPAEIADLLSTLFGGYGASLLDRLSFFRRTGKDTVRLDDLNRAIQSLKSLQFKGNREWSDVAEHGINRLESIANWMEEQNATEIPLKAAK